MSQMKAALHAVELGMSFRAAAREFNVNYMTLFKHHKNPDLSFYHGGLTTLLPDEEIAMKDWIVASKNRGKQMRDSAVIQRANAILRHRVGASAKVLTRRWMESFLKRQCLDLQTPKNLTNSSACISEQEKNIEGDCERNEKKPLGNIRKIHKLDKKCRCCFRLLRSKRKAVEITEIIEQKFHQLTNMKVSSSASNYLLIIIIIFSLYLQEVLPVLFAKSATSN